MTSAMSLDSSRLRWQNGGRRCSVSEPKCPTCGNTGIRKAGFYVRSSDRKKVQRFSCDKCSKKWSSQTFSHDYRLRKRWIDQPVFRNLASGVSERRCAQLFDVGRKSISIRVERFGLVCRDNLVASTSSSESAENIQFDEMETFEHTKCKPITIGLAVEANSRKVLSVHCGSIRAKGKLADIAKQKYGVRECQRKGVLTDLFTDLQKNCVATVQAESDMSPHYAKPFYKAFPEGDHIRHKGRKGCVTGQGEMKAGGRDPLFWLNHTAAMFRDNLKRLTRRTWCTTKRIDRLQRLLDIYAWAHNLRLEAPRINLRRLSMISN